MHSCSCRSDGDSMQPDKDALLRKLMEAELDGTAAAKQVSALRESVSKLCGASGSVSIKSIFGLIMCPDRPNMLYKPGNSIKQQAAFTSTAIW